MARQKRDLSPDEIVFSKILRDCFDLEQEDLPPLYLETLYDQATQEASQAAESLEERITRRVFAQVGLKRHQPGGMLPSEQASTRSKKAAALWSKQGWRLAPAAGMLTLILLLGLALLYPPTRQGVQAALEALFQPSTHSTQEDLAEQSTILSFNSTWEAQPYVDFMIVPLNQVPTGFRLDEIQVRGSSSVALIYRHWNAEIGYWEQFTLLEYRSEAGRQGMPFPTPQVIGSEQRLEVNGRHIFLIKPESIPEGEGTVRAHWQSDGITFCLYGYLTAQEIKDMARGLLHAFDE